MSAWAASGDWATKGPIGVRVDVLPSELCRGGKAERGDRGLGVDVVEGGVSQQCGDGVGFEHGEHCPYEAAELRFDVVEMACSMSWNGGWIGPAC